MSPTCTWYPCGRSRKETRQNQEEKPLLLAGFPTLSVGKTLRNVNCAGRLTGSTTITAEQPMKVTLQQCGKTLAVMD